MQKGTTEGDVDSGRVEVSAMSGAVGSMESFEARSQDGNNAIGPVLVSQRALIAMQTEANH